MQSIHVNFLFKRQQMVQLNKVSLVLRVIIHTCIHAVWQKDPEDCY